MSETMIYLTLSLLGIGGGFAGLWWGWRLDRIERCDRRVFWRERLRKRYMTDTERRFERIFGITMA